MDDQELQRARAFANGMIRDCTTNGYTSKVIGDSEYGRFVYDDGEFRITRQKRLGDAPQSPQEKAAATQRSERLWQKIEELEEQMTEEEIAEHNAGLARLVDSLKREMDEEPPIPESIWLEVSPNNPVPSKEALFARAAALSQLGLPVLEHLSLADEHVVGITVKPNSTPQDVAATYNAHIEESEGFRHEREHRTSQVNTLLRTLPTHTLQDEGYVDYGPHMFRITFARAQSTETLERIAQKITDALYQCEDYEMMDCMRVLQSVGYGVLIDHDDHSEIRIAPQEGASNELVIAIPQRFDTALHVFESLTQQPLSQGRRGR